MIVPFPQAIYAHSDILAALFLALRDGVKRNLVDYTEAAQVMELASRGDCSYAKKLLENVLEHVR